MATAPAIGAALTVLPPPQYPDGRYALPSDEVLRRSRRCCIMQHAQHCAVCRRSGALGARAAARAVQRAVGVRAARRAGGAAVWSTLYAPVRNILGVLGASGIADDACVLLHVRDAGRRGGEFGAHLLPLDAPLVR
jgi:hypothetical protein